METSDRSSLSEAAKAREDGSIKQGLSQSSLTAEETQNANQMANKNNVS